MNPTWGGQEEAPHTPLHYRADKQQHHQSLTHSLSAESLHIKNKSDLSKAQYVSHYSSGRLVLQVLLM
ncbi:hypothetical protein E2C01_086104 [Portunus trituberculatus]|uniref:Uncharacterized protein n=1 Tax=Portunus trituberculatus TaxID=210409 RepID=A0A5B7J8E2_PORTR|nr:hypothetical protein [Portunus trituberculatus]